MKKFLVVAALVSMSEAIKIDSLNRDEVDDLLAKQDQKDENEVRQKEFDDAGSKMNQIGNVSRNHSQAEDDDYMKSVFDTYSVAGKDKRG